MKRRLPAYDEASSGSDDSSTSTSSSSDDESSVASEGESNTKPENASDGSSSSMSDDESETSESSSLDSKDDDNSQDSDDDESSADDGSSDDDDLPLHERIQKREEKGLSLQNSRKRKSQALQVASERLAKFKERKSKTKDNDPTSLSSKSKKSKHAPTEVSSKRSDFFKRGAPKLNESGIGVEIGANRYKPLDPRTSNLSGHYNEEQFEQNYAFLEKIRQKEISKLKKQIAARKITGRKGQSLRKKLGISNKGSLEEDQEELKRLQQERADLERRKLNRAAKQQVKKKMREQVEQGKGGAYFLKRKEKRRLELEAKMEQIRKKGGDAAVEKAISKRRKKQKSRDAKRFL